MRPREIEATDPETGYPVTIRYTYDVEHDPSVGIFHAIDVDILSATASDDDGNDVAVEPAEWMSDHIAQRIWEAM